jgi:hypothetical protein
MTLRAASRARFQNNLGQIGLTQVAHATRSDWHFPGGVAPSLVGLQEGVLFADGSVRWMAIDINPGLWRALLSVADREDINLVAERVLSP